MTSPADNAETATEARLRLLEEEFAAEADYYGRIAEDEARAEAAWLRRAEYDPQHDEDRMQTRYDRDIYGD